MHLKELLSEIHVNHSSFAQSEIGLVHRIDNLTNTKVRFCWASPTEKGKVSYLDEKRASKISLRFNDISDYSLNTLASHAYTCAPGRFIRKLEAALPDSGVAKLAEQFMSRFVTKIEVIDQVENVYDSAKCVSKLASCMTDTPYVRFYSENGVKAVASIDANGKVLARALLWENCEEINGGTDPITFVDLVYGPPSEVIAIKAWAAKEGYFFGSHGELTTPEGVHCYPKIRFKLKNPLTRVYPYIDTMRYLDLVNGWAYNESQEGTDIAASTGGKVNNWFCRNCGEWLGERKITRVGAFCEPCLHKFFFNIDGKWYTNSETDVCCICGGRHLNHTLRSGGRYGYICAGCDKTHALVEGEIIRRELYARTS